MASLTSTVVNYTLPGFKPADRAIKPVPVPVYFRAPASQLERGKSYPGVGHVVDSFFLTDMVG